MLHVEYLFLSLFPCVIPLYYHIGDHIYSIRDATLFMVLYKGPNMLTSTHSKANIARFQSYTEQYSLGHIYIVV